MKYSTIYILINRTYFFQYLCIFSQRVTFSLNINMVFNEFLHFENNKKKDDVHKCSEHRIVPPQSERSQTQSSWGTFLTECALMDYLFSNTSFG